ncbi:MAG TPA: GxxExxY protein [Anaerolineae bacterium]|nr:GxxExxY protein [Anaerolineae bacterium]
MSATLKYGELTGEILNAFFTVYNRLGFGFLERVYENALAYELRKRGYRVTQQAPITVRYDAIVVGEYFADILVDGKVIVELKTAERISEAHVAQLVNYLKATGIEVGLLLNFGPKPEFRRKVFTPSKKSV